MKHPLSHIIFLLFCPIFTFYSCDSNANQQIEISFWAMGAEGEKVQSLIPEFQRRHPKTKVKVQMVPWTAAQEKLITAFASDNLPDVFQLGNTWIPQFQALNAIEKLDDWITKSDHIHKSNYFKGIWNTNMIHGSIYGIPWYIDTRVLFYRTDVVNEAGFDGPPETWNQLYQLSKQIKNMHESQGSYAIYLPTNEWSIFIIFGLQLNANLLRANNSYGNFSSPAFERAFKFVIRFHKEALAPTGLTQVSNIYQAFANKFISMYISGPWNVPEFKKWMSGDLADKWMTATLPGPNKNTPGISLAGGSSLVISKQSDQKQAAWKFVEYLSETQTQLDFYQLTSDLPAVKSAWEDSTLKSDPYMQAFYRQFHHVVATPKIPEWEQIAFSKLQQYAEYAARAVMSPEEALEKLDEDVDKILEKRRWLLSRE